MTQTLAVTCCLCHLNCLVTNQSTVDSPLGNADKHYLCTRLEFLLQKRSQQPKNRIYSYLRFYYFIPLIYDFHVVRLWVSERHSAAIFRVDTGLHCVNTLLAVCRLYSQAHRFSAAVLQGGRSVLPLIYSKRLFKTGKISEFLGYCCYQSFQVSCQSVQVNVTKVSTSVLPKCLDHLPKFLGQCSYRSFQVTVTEVSRSLLLPQFLGHCCYTVSMSLLPKFLSLLLPKFLCLLLPKLLGFRTTYACGRSAVQVTRIMLFECSSCVNVFNSNAP